MRHQKSGRKFNRTSAHRDAMFSQHGGLAVQAAN